MDKWSGKHFFSSILISGTDNPWHSGQFSFSGLFYHVNEIWRDCLGFVSTCEDFAHSGLNGRIPWSESGVFLAPSRLRAGESGFGSGDAQSRVSEGDAGKVGRQPPRGRRGAWESWQRVDRDRFPGEWAPWRPRGTQGRLGQLQGGPGGDKTWEITRRGHPASPCSNPVSDENTLLGKEAWERPDF